MSHLPLLVSNEPRRSVIGAMANELGLSDHERDLAFRLFADGLPPLVTRDCLPFLFGISPKLVGAMGARPEAYYREFTVPKRSGGQRTIRSPRRFLKLIQRWIARWILAPLEVSPSSYGFRPGLSIFDNAYAHLGRRYLLCMDLHDFFPSIKADQVKQTFAVLGFPGPVVAQLTKLCVYENELPQGACTSPALSNVVARDLDFALSEWADGLHVTYTRYADDLAFSSDSPFETDHFESIEQQIREYGFRVNSNKTRAAGPGERREVTGLVVHASVQPRKSVRKRWRAMFHRASKYPREFVGRTSELAGIVGMVSQYDTALAAEYRQVIGKVRMAARRERSAN